MPVKQIAENGSKDEGFSMDIARHIPALRGLAKALTRNREAAADLTQETLAKAWQARRTFAAGTNMRAWLFTIMRNQFRSEKRRAWRQMPWNEKAAQHIPAPGDEQNLFVELADAARAIGTLSKRQRDALILAGVGGLSSMDVARITGCRPTAAKSRVCRARHAVRSMLDGAEPLGGASRTERCGQDIDGLLRQLDLLTGNAA
jgi:RNA polymerase sigma-70 factor (ECF subfamily)